MAGRRSDRGLRVGVDLRPLLPDRRQRQRSLSRGLDRRWRRWPRPPAACAWAPWSPGSTTGTRPCWPTWSPPWTSSPAAGSSWGSAPGGTRRSPGPTASNWAPRASAVTASRRPARCSSACCPSRRPRSRAATTSSPKPGTSRSGRSDPHPPICIGGQREKRTLRTAARFAQHWNFVGGTTEDFARKREVLACALRRHRPRPGRDHAVVTREVRPRRGRLGHGRPGRRARPGRTGPGHRLPAPAAHPGRPRTTGGSIGPDQLIVRATRPGQI